MVWRKRLLILGLVLGLAAGGVALLRALAPQRSASMVVAVAKLVLPEERAQAVETRLATDTVEVELCGFGRYALTDSSASSFPLDVKRGSDLAVRRLVERLGRSDQARDRALGLFLASREPWLREGSCDDGPPQCQARRIQASAAPTQALAELASTSRDPGVYALALEACKGRHPDKTPACARLAYSAWAERDPGNFAAAVRISPGEGAAARRAWLDRLAQSDRFESYSSLLYSLLAEPELRDVGEAVRVVNLVQVEGLIAAHSVPQFQPLLQACGQGGEREGRAACAHIAERMLAKPGDFIEFRIGAALGKQLGWDEARISGLNEERARLFAALHGSRNELAVDGALNLSCQTKALIERRAAARQTLSEVEYARVLLAEAKLPPPPSPLANPFGRPSSR